MERRTRNQIAALAIILTLGWLYYLSLDNAGRSASPRLAERLEMVQEALRRTDAFLEYSVDSMDETTGLFARNTGDEKLWSPKDNAADYYPYMVIAARFLDDDRAMAMARDVLRDETGLTTRSYGLVDDYDILNDGFKFQDTDPARMLFNSAEYAKDGLLPIVDIMGADSPWTKRLIFLTDRLIDWKHLWKNAPNEPRGVEMDGDILQVLCRVFWLTGERRYLDEAKTIADWYLFKDPLADRPRITLRDHGNEIIVGLSEFYFAMAHADPISKNGVYRKAVYKLFDRVLRDGISENGMVLEYADSSPAPSKSIRLTDNWGYIMSAVLTVGMTDNKTNYIKAVDRTMSAMAKMDGYEWEPRFPYDGYADSIESAIILLSFRPNIALDAWVDRQMPEMWRLEDDLIKNGPDYLYGNIARTNIMYALMRTDGSKSFISVRHRDVWNMPWNYPRINAMPEYGQKKRALR